MIPYLFFLRQQERKFALLLIITSIAATITNSTGLNYLCPLIPAERQALRPMATENASTRGAEIEPYNIAPLDDESRAGEPDDDSRFLMEALSPSGGEKPAQDETETDIDKKVAQRQAQRGGNGSGAAGEAGANADDVERKLSARDENEQFMNFWARQAAVTIPPAGMEPDAFQMELATGEGASLGAPEHLDLYFEVESARGEVAREAGITTSSKIAKIRTGLPAIDNPDLLFNKSTGYLLYAAQINCDADTIRKLGGYASVYKDDADGLKLVISKILELIEERVKPREKIERIRQQLPGVNNAAELFSKATSYLAYISQHRYDTAEIERLRAEIASNKDKPENLKRVILKLLTIVEIQEGSRGVPLAGEETGPPQEYRYDEIGLDKELPFQIRRVSLALENFKKRWAKRLVTTTSRTSRLPVNYLPLLLKQAQQLTGEKVTDFYDIAFGELTLFDIIQLHEQGVRQYIIVGTTHRGEFEYILMPLKGSRITSEGRTRLTKGYAGRIRALGVRPFRGGGRLREDIMVVTKEVPTATIPYNLMAPPKFDYAA